MARKDKMIRVITYGTFDMLHHGHIRLLERAKALGDYLVVGVTSDDFDKSRGKINVKQSLIERIEAVKSTGIADEIIVEEYEGQKIEDIRNFRINIFTVGSDWKGKFDYLSSYCKVVYLERTSGISSSEIRSASRTVKMGLVGDALFLDKVMAESKYVNGIDIVGVCSNNIGMLCKDLQNVDIKTNDFDKLITEVDALYIRSIPQKHYSQIKKAIEMGKHVLCESPLSLSYENSDELLRLAKARKIVLMEGIKTAYATAYNRMLLLVKEGKIGQVVALDATCTSLIRLQEKVTDWSGLYEWGPTALLPVFQILGTDYRDTRIITKVYDDNPSTDAYTRVDFLYDHAFAEIKVGDGVKSEGELVISGTNGYIYVPAPWWKTEYFEIRYEDQNLNRRYFYTLDGEGIRYELVTFVRAIEEENVRLNIDNEVTCKISEIMSDYENKKNMTLI